MNAGTTESADLGVCLSFDERYVFRRVVGSHDLSALVSIIELGRGGKCHEPRSFAVKNAGNLEVKDGLERQGGHS